MCTHRQWCFRLPIQNSKEQPVHLLTAWSGTQSTLELLDVGTVSSCTLAGEAALARSSTASQEHTEIFSPASMLGFLKET